MSNPPDRVVWTAEACVQASDSAETPFGSGNDKRSTLGQTSTHNPHAGTGDTRTQHSGAHGRMESYGVGMTLDSTGTTCATPQHTQGAQHALMLAAAGKQDNRS